jgi:rhodanese-related sulfurtransferase
MKRTIVVAALSLALAPACSRSSSATVFGTTASESGSPGAQARKLVAEGAPLLDVRTPAEFEAKHLPSAVNIPVDEVAPRMGDIERLTRGDRATPIVVYCRSGARSARAAAMLQKAGYSRVTDLGPISAWDG